MSSLMRIRIAGVALVTSLALAAGTAAGAPGAGSYEPFVTDFPRGVPSQTYTPFATDFGIGPRPAGATVEIRSSAKPTATAGGLDWGDVTIGAGLGLAFAAALAATMLVVQVRRRSSGTGPATAIQSSAQPAK